VKRIIAAAMIAAGLGTAQHDPQHTPPPVEHAAEHAQAAVKHGEGHEEAPMPNEIWWKLANFAVLVGGLGFLIGKHVGPFFRNRTSDIQRGIAEATAVRNDAEARAVGIEKRVAGLQAEIETLRAQSREEIAREGERVRAETAQQIDKIRRHAEGEIASAAKHAQQELKAYAADLAVRMAAQQIEQQMNGRDHEQLADAFIGDIRRKAEMN
jgi:F-type H+-transporting ATPase subunit b